MSSARSAWIVALIVSCGPAPSKPVRQAEAPETGASAAPEHAVKHRLKLPLASNTIDFEAQQLPHVVLEGEQVLLDDATVATTGEILAEQRLRRLDGLFESLKRWREAWQTAHPGEEFPGVVVFWFDASAPVLVVKSVFQTAAFAGFPNGSFAVGKARAPEQFARINADARVPGPAPLPIPGDPFHLHLEIDQGKAQMIWKCGHEVVQVLDVPAHGLQQMVSEQWQAYGGHREGRDHVFDQAVLHIDNKASFAAVIEAIDTLNGPKREFTYDGVTEQVPAFNVTFAIN